MRGPWMLHLALKHGRGELTVVSTVCFSSYEGFNPDASRDDLARARGPFEQYYCSNDGGEQVVVHACDWRICNPDFFRVC